MTKISIIGTGRVGSSVAMHCANHRFGDLVLIDRYPNKAKGLYLDLLQASPLDDIDLKIYGGGYDKTKNSDIIVITAGLPRKPGMTREELLNVNAKIVAEVTRKTAKLSKNAIYIIVTNPLDAMCYINAKVSKFPKHKIVGMAGLLDTSRFRAFIAQELKVSVKDIETLVLGSHGDEMVPLISHTFIGKEKITKFLSRKKINYLVEKTRNAGAEIVALEKEGSAFIAPGAAIAHMIDSIINDKKRILPCSAWLNGQYNVKGMFMGVPVILGKDGVEKIIEVEMEKNEKEKFAKSVKAISNSIKNLNKILKHGNI